MLRTALICFAVAAFSAAPAWSQIAKKPSEFIETKERLGVAAMEALVAGPMGLARAKDWPAAQESLERLLERRRETYGAASIEVADTLVAFMILNFNGERKVEALAYAPRAIDVVRQVWGSDHVEYGLLLNDIVMMDYEYNKDAVGRESEAALAEVFRIRSASLGPTHPETISTLIYLGQIQGLRSRTRGDLSRALPAITTLRRAISTLEAAPTIGSEDNLWARTTLAETFARNGALLEALQTFNTMLAMAKVRQVDQGHRVVGFAAALQEGGFEKEANAIMRPYLDLLGVENAGDS